MRKGKGGKRQLKSTPHLRGCYNITVGNSFDLELKSTHRLMGCYNWVAVRSPYLYNWQTLAAKRSKEEFSSPLTTSNPKSVIVPPGAKMFFARL